MVVYSRYDEVRTDTGDPVGVDQATGDDLSSADQEYTRTIINEIRSYVEVWRSLPNPDQWQVTPETARLLQHWRHHRFQGIFVPDTSLTAPALLRAERCTGAQRCTGKTPGD